jgi:hypothetical protein
MANSRDQKSKVNSVISFLHWKIHDEELYITNNFETLAASASVDYLLVSGAKDVHINFVVTGQTNIRATLKEGATCTALGATSTAVNLYRESSKTAAATFYYAPTGCTASTQLAQDIILGVNDRFAGLSPASIRSNTEWVFRPNEKYLLRLENRDATTSVIKVDAEFYEIAE